MVVVVVVVVVEVVVVVVVVVVSAAMMTMTITPIMTSSRPQATLPSPNQSPTAHLGTPAAAARADRRS